MSKKYNLTATAYDKRGRVLAVAVNDYTKTHPRQKHYAVLAGLPEKENLHAEILCIIRALRVGTPYKISVSRFGKDGRHLNAEPCPICKLAIKEAGISMVEYTIG